MPKSKPLDIGLSPILTAQPTQPIETATIAVICSCAYALWWGKKQLWPRLLWFRSELDGALCLEEIEPLERLLVAKRDDSSVVDLCGRKIKGLQVIQASEERHTSGGDISAREIDRTKIRKGRQYFEALVCHLSACQLGIHDEIANGLQASES